MTKVDLIKTSTRRRIRIPRTDRSPLEIQEFQEKFLERAYFSPIDKAVIEENYKELSKSFLRF